MWIHWPFFPKSWTKGHWPLDDLWPMSVEVTCVTLPKDHCVQVPWWYINVCGYSDQFCKLPHTYIHILRTYYIHTTYYVQNEWSHSLLLNSVQARQKKCTYFTFSKQLYAEIVTYKYQVINTLKTRCLWLVQNCLLQKEKWIYFTFSKQLSAEIVIYKHQVINILKT